MLRSRPPREFRLEPLRLLHLLPALRSNALQKTIQA